jgi:hypothetical protein
MLFLVSIQPYLFYMISLSGHGGEEALLDYASLMYAVDMASLMAILALFSHELTIEEKQLFEPELTSRYVRIRNSNIIGTALFLVTVLPQFWSLRLLGTPLRFYFWYVPIVLSVARKAFEKPPRADRASARKQSIVSP